MRSHNYNTSPLCGRTIHTILQSDQEDILTALLTAVANKNRNTTTTNSGAYSPQSQGGVERAHGALVGQIRTLRAQVRQNYNRGITMEHQLLPWIVRHSAHTAMEQQATSTNQVANNTPLCEFGETVQCVNPKVKQNKFHNLSQFSTMRSGFFGSATWRFIRSQVSKL